MTEYQQEHILHYHREQTTIIDILSGSDTFKSTHESSPFEYIDCPDIPSHDYPRSYNLTHLLDHWNSSITEIPSFHYDSLCHFDYQNSHDRKKALSYRQAERPFVVYNIPELDQASEKWKDINYIIKMLGNVYTCTSIFPLYHVYMLTCHIC
jgi:hypothetical protein